MRKGGVISGCGSQSACPARDRGGPTLGKRQPPSPHLSVDGPDDGRLEPHPRHKADVEVLVQDQRLQAGREEEEAGVEEALPAGGALVVDKVNEQPRKEKAETLQEGTTGRPKQSPPPQRPGGRRALGHSWDKNKHPCEVQSNKGSTTENSLQFPDIKGQRRGRGDAMAGMPGSAA